MHVAMPKCLRESPALRSARCIFVSCMLGIETDICIAMIDVYAKWNLQPIAIVLYIHEVSLKNLSALLTIIVGWAQTVNC